MWSEKDRFQRNPGSLHTHSRFSGTPVTPREIAGLAMEKGLRVLVFTDYSDREWRYRCGLRLTRPSVLKYGVREYLDTLEKLRKEFRDLIIVSGLEASPFYFWEGTPLNLKCREYNRHILLLGLNTAEDVEDLPLMATGRSGFNPFNGNQGSRPYQALIDAARQKGLLTFWAHPEQEDDTRFFTARLFTPARPELLLETTGYTGFSAYPRGARSVPEPGGIWDQVLKAFCDEKKEKPIWVIGESDYRKKTDAIDNPTTIFVDPVSSPGECITALEKGRVYARDDPGKTLYLNRFHIVHENSERRASMGETLRAFGKIRVWVEMEAGAGIRKAVLVKGGKAVFSTAEAQFDFHDTAAEKQPTYFRLMVTAKDGGRLLSNPIFLNPA